MMIEYIKTSEMKRQIVQTVLNDLPAWFGVEAYTEAYIKNSVDRLLFAAKDKDTFIGFVMLKETSKDTLEIDCMGIMKAYHRQGYGKALMEVAFDYAQVTGYQIMQVKTVAVGHYKEYDRTHAFYKACGFYDLEVLPTLWDAHNPCQVMVRPLVSDEGK